MQWSFGRYGKEAGHSSRKHPETATTISSCCCYEVKTFVESAIFAVGVNSIWKYLTSFVTRNIWLFTAINIIITNQMCDGLLRYARYGQCFINKQFILITFGHFDYDWNTYDINFLAYICMNIPSDNAFIIWDKQQLIALHHFYAEDNEHKCGQLCSSGWVRLFLVKAYDMNRVWRKICSTLHLSNLRISMVISHNNLTNEILNLISNLNSKNVYFNRSNFSIIKIN